MSAYEPIWRPVRPRNHRDLPTLFLHLFPTKGKRSLYSTTLTYRRMTSYLPVALRSHVIHHPRMPQKPNLEKGQLADPADPSMSRDARYREKPAVTDTSQSQLVYMCPNNPGVSPHWYHPCTLPLGLLPLHTCFSPPSSGDHRTFSPLPSVNISWITNLLVASLYRPSPCTTALLIRTITCCISTKQWSSTPGMIDFCVNCSRPASRTLLWPGSTSFREGP